MVAVETEVSLVRMILDAVCLHAIPTTSVVFVPTILSGNAVRVPSKSDVKKRLGLVQLS